MLAGICGTIYSIPNAMHSTRTDHRPTPQSSTSRRQLQLPMPQRLSVRHVNASRPTTSPGEARRVACACSRCSSQQGKHDDNTHRRGVRLRGKQAYTPCRKPTPARPLPSRSSLTRSVWMPVSTGSSSKSAATSFVRAPRSKVRMKLVKLSRSASVIS